MNDCPCCLGLYLVPAPALATRYGVRHAWQALCDLCLTAHALLRDCGHPTPTARYLRGAA